MRSRARRVDSVRVADRWTLGRLSGFRGPACVKSSDGRVAEDSACGHLVWCWSMLNTVPRTVVRRNVAKGGDLQGLGCEHDRASRRRRGQDERHARQLVGGA